MTACAETHKAYGELLKGWEKLTNDGIKKLDERLRKESLPPLKP